MLLRAVREYWVLYAMVGITVLGMMSLIWLSCIIRGLLRDLGNQERPRKKLVKQMKKKYESCCQSNGEIRNLDAFVVNNLYGNRFFGFTMNSIRKIWGQALFLCMVLTAGAAFYSYQKVLPEEYMINYIGAGIGLMAWMVFFHYGMDITAKQAVLEAAVYDYLENYLELRLDKKAEQVESDIEFLKDSLKQIAADSEKRRGKKTYVPDAKDGKIIEEVLNEFFA